jgi:hypothetical protein
MDLNSGPHIFSAGTLPLEPLHQSWSYKIFLHFALKHFSILNMVKFIFPQ